MKKGEWHVEITPHYALGSDSDQYVIKYRPNKMDPKSREPIPGEYSAWVNIKFFGDPNQMVRALKHRLLRETPVRSAQDIYDAIEHIDQIFSKKHFKVEAEVTIR